jgi:hypothetical protein
MVEHKKTLFLIMPHTEKGGDSQLYHAVRSTPESYY